MRWFTCFSAVMVHYTSNRNGYPLLLLSAAPDCSTALSAVKSLKIVKKVGDTHGSWFHDPTPGSSKVTPLQLYCRLRECFFTLYIYYVLFQFQVTLTKEITLFALLHIKDVGSLQS